MESAAKICVNVIILIVLYGIIQSHSLNGTGGSNDTG